MAAKLLGGVSGRLGQFFEKEQIVTIKKKTLYEILAVAPHASHEDILATHQSLMSRLQSQKQFFTPAEYEVKLQIIQVAFNTLSSPTARQAYDQDLALQAAMASSSALAVPMAPQADPASMALRAEAISLRAEAMSLRADALSIRSDAVTLSSREPFPSLAQTGVSALMLALRKILMTVGGLVAVWMVMQVVFLFMANKRSELDAGQAAKANEKVVLQEYYQTHGVRPASKTEADLLEAESRRKDAEMRAAERAKQKTEDDSRRFEEDAQRRAAEVSSELRYAENQARELARRDEEQKNSLDEQKRRQEEAERYQAQRQREKWQETIRR